MVERYRPLSPNPNANDERLLHRRNRAYVDGQLTPEIIDSTARLMRERAPAKRLMSRHTRETLRQYASEGPYPSHHPGAARPPCRNPDERGGTPSVRRN